MSRLVESEDGMTADWGHLSHETLQKISNRVIYEVHGINRVVLDISSKPPATIEWESFRRYQVGIKQLRRRPAGLQRRNCGGVV